MRKLSPPEVELVRHLVAGTEPPERGDAVDWNLVLSSAGCHRLTPLMFLGAQQSNIHVPSPILDRLEKGFQVELARAVVRLHHIDALEAAAARTGRALCLLKGAAFAGTLYQHPAMRPMADIDVLVRVQECEAWESELDALGFRHLDTSDHASCYRHRQSGVYLELHRALTSCGDYLGIDLEALWERSTIASGSLRTLSLEDHLIHVCLHGSFQHGFRQAGVNARDAQLLVDAPGFDATRFLTLSRSPRVAPWVYGGLRLSAATFPSERLSTLAEGLRDVVPARMARKLARLDAGSGLQPEASAIAKPPFRRILWAGDFAEIWTLLIEVLRTRASSPRGRARPSAARAAELFWNHCVKAISLALMKQAQTFSRPTPASLGEVRDV